jgi:hypothetical protein
MLCFFLQMNMLWNSQVSGEDCSSNVIVKLWRLKRLGARPRRYLRRFRKLAHQYMVGNDRILVSLEA